MLTDIISYTISKLLPIRHIGHIFALDRGSLYFSLRHLLGWQTPKFRTRKLDVKKVEETRITCRSILLYILDILCRLGLNHDCDGQIDIQTEWPLQQCTLTQLELDNH